MMLSLTNPSLICWLNPLPWGPKKSHDSFRNLQLKPLTSVIQSEWICCQERLNKPSHRQYFEQSDNAVRNLWLTPLPRFQLSEVGVRNPWVNPLPLCFNLSESGVRNPRPNPVPQCFKLREVGVRDLWPKPSPTVHQATWWCCQESLTKPILPVIQEMSQRCQKSLTKSPVTFTGHKLLWWQELQTKPSHTLFQSLPLFQTDDAIRNLRLNLLL